MKKLALIATIIIISIKIQAQNFSDNEKYFTPMISIGYSIESGFTYGFDFTFGLVKLTDSKEPLYWAISNKFYFLNLNGYSNRVFSVNFVVENNFVRIGGGFGQIKRKWGYNNRNKSKTFGPTTDFGIHYADQSMPWIGFKTITPIFKNGWYERNFSANFYTYFRYKNLIISKP